MRKQQASGAYDKIESAKEFAEKLSAELKVIGKDQHLKVEFSPQDLLKGPEVSADVLKERMLEHMKKNNYGVLKAEKRDGNIGFLELSSFSPHEFSKNAIKDAMNYLSDTDALVIDLRNNEGGDPAAVANLLSYMLDNGVHLNDFVGKDGKVESSTYTSQPEGKKFGKDKPVYILTSGKTFSAAEEFAYDAQALGRATVVGEQTRGGANPGNAVALDSHFSAFVPHRKAVNPITKSNWESVEQKGVQPKAEHSVPALQAEEKALQLARQELAKLRREANAQTSK